MRIILWGAPLSGLLTLGKIKEVFFSLPEGLMRLGNYFYDLEMLKLLLQYGYKGSEPLY